MEKLYAIYNGDRNFMSEYGIFANANDAMEALKEAQEFDKLAVVMEVPKHHFGLNTIIKAVLVSITLLVIMCFAVFFEGTLGMILKIIQLVSSGLCLLLCFLLCNTCRTISYSEGKEALTASTVLIVLTSLLSLLALFKMVFLM